MLRANLQIKIFIMCFLLFSCSTHTKLSVKKTKNLCVIEHGWPNSSISSDIISKVLSKVKLKNKPIQICWPNSHIPTAHELEEKFYFSSKDIVKKILKNFK